MNLTRHINTGLRSFKETLDEFKGETDNPVKSLEVSEMFNEVISSSEEYPFKKRFFNHLTGNDYKKARLTLDHYVCAGAIELIRAFKDYGYDIVMINHEPHVYCGTHYIPFNLIHGKEDCHINKVKDYLVKIGVPEQLARTSRNYKEFYKTFLEEIPTFSKKKVENMFIHNMNNGTLTIKDGEINFKKGVFKKEYPITYRMGFDYNPNAKCPKTKAFLWQSLQDESAIAFLQEYYGYVLSPTMNREIALCLLGGGANGKSVAITLLAEVLGGTKNTLSASLEQITTDDNTLFSALGKTLIYCTDISTKFDAAKAKQIISREPLSLVPKYRGSIHVNGYDIPKILMSANSLPSTTESTNGLYRRFEFIPFRFMVKKEDRIDNLAKILVDEEGSGILNWIIEGFLRLERNNAFTKCQLSENIKVRFKEDTDNVLMFLLDNEYKVEETEGYKRKKLHKKAFYSEFMQYCDENHIKYKLTRGRFFENLHSKGVDIEKPRDKKGYYIELFVKQELF